jgi:hypothetical protein
VVLFGGAYLQPGAQRFLVLIAEHPEMELIGGFCEGPGQGWSYRLTNVWRRRGLLALPVLLIEGFELAATFSAPSDRGPSFRTAAPAGDAQGADGSGHPRAGRAGAGACALRPMSA